MPLNSYTPLFTKPANRALGRLNDRDALLVVPTLARRHRCRRHCHQKRGTQQKACSEYSILSSFHCPSPSKVVSFRIALLEQPFWSDFISAVR